MASSTDSLCEVAVQAVATAGRMLFSQHFRRLDLASTTTGRSHEVVSEADLASHRLLSDLLAAARPNDGFVSEEGAERIGALTWLVDPLDGSANFVRGIPHWCVSAACLDLEGTPVVAAVYDPCRDELFTFDGSGARLDGRSIQTSPVSRLSEAVVAFGVAPGAASRDFRRDVIDRVVDGCAAGLSHGAPILEQAWVACGRLDGYADFWLHQWDVVAGRALIEAAGGAAMAVTWEQHSGGLLAAATSELLIELDLATTDLRGVDPADSGTGPTSEPAA